jgi:hypothetical protein
VIWRATEPPNFPPPERPLIPTLFRTARSRWFHSSMAIEKGKIADELQKIANGFQGLFRLYINVTIPLVGGSCQGNGPRRARK